LQTPTSLRTPYGPDNGYGYTNAKGKAVEGLGGGFQFCKLSDEPLFTPDGQIRSDVTFAQLAEFVWFAETGAGFNGRVDSLLLSVHEGRTVYLLYNGILKDLSFEGGNILTGPVYENLPVHNGPKVIYAAACRLGAARRGWRGNRSCSNRRLMHWRFELCQRSVFSTAL